MFQVFQLFGKQESRGKTQRGQLFIYRHFFIKCKEICAILFTLYIYIEMNLIKLFDFILKFKSKRRGEQ